MKKVHAILYFERNCPKCEKRLLAKVHNYGLLDFETLDEKVGHTDFEVKPFACPKCEEADYPEAITMYDESKDQPELIFRKIIGSEEMPVVGEAGPYGVTRSAEEQAEYDRGLEKVPDVWAEGKTGFWQGYCQWAMEDWRKAVSELEISEMVAGFQAIGTPLLPGSASVAAWRKSVREMEEANRSIFWQVANTEMVEKDILWVFPDHWDMEKFIRRYGRERMRYVILHVPLPEELEKWRTEAVAKLVKKKKTGDTGILFERIGQLGQELERQRRRSQQLSQQLRAERQQRSELEEKLSDLRRQLEATKNGEKLISRDANDIRKIRELKGLVKELRAEVSRLNDLIPEPEAELITETEEHVAEEEEPSDLSHLAGKTVALFGRLADVEEVEGVRLLYHDGDRINLSMGRVAREADILVVLTRFVSHSVMWWLKEYAVDEGKEIRFVRESGIQRILERI